MGFVPIVNVIQDCTVGLVNTVEGIGQGNLSKAGDGALYIGAGVIGIVTLGWLSSANAIGKAGKLAKTAGALDTVADTARALDAVSDLRHVRSITRATRNFKQAGEAAAKGNTQGAAMSWIFGESNLLS
jgi:hypothetical protein